MILYTRVTYDTRRIIRHMSIEKHYVFYYKSCYSDPVFPDRAGAPFLLCIFFDEFVVEKHNCQFISTRRAPNSLVEC